MRRLKTQDSKQTVRSILFAVAIFGTACSESQASAPLSDARLDATDSGSELGSDASDATLDARDIGAESEVQAAMRELRDVEYRRLTTDPRLMNALNSDKPEIVREAIRVAGQIRASVVGSRVLAFFQSADAATRLAAVRALAYLSSDEATTAMVSALGTEADLAVRSTLFINLQNADNDLVFRAALARVMSGERTAEAYRTALYAISRHIRSEAVAATPRTTRTESVPLSLARRIWEDIQGAGSDEAKSRASYAALAMQRMMRASSAPANALANEILSAFSSIPSRDARKILLDGIKALGTPDALALIRTTVRNDADPFVRAYAITLLPTPEAQGDVHSLLLAAASDSDPHVVAGAIEKMATVPSAFASELAALTRLQNASSSLWNAGDFLKLRNAIDPNASRSAVIAASNHASLVMQKAAIAAMAAKPHASFVPELMRLAGSSEGVIRIAALDAFGEQGMLLTEEAKAMLHTALNSTDKYASLGAMSAIEDLDWVDEITRDETIAAFRRFQSSASDAELYYYTYAMGEARWSGATALLNEIVDTHPTRYLIQRAAESLKKITGMDVDPSRIPANNRVESGTPTDLELDAALHSKIRFTTERGTFEMQHNPNAPLAWVDMTRIVGSSFFDGTHAHLVTSYATALLGDALWTRLGPSRQTVVEQLESRVEWLPQDVGLTTSGWGTQNSEIFFNLASNLSFGNIYTCIGTLVSGIDVATNMQQGDRILRVELVSTR